MFNLEDQKFIKLLDLNAQIYTESEFNCKHIHLNPKALALYYFGDDKKEIDNILDNTTSGQTV